MSYFTGSGSGSGNNTLAFPSYSQANLQPRGISGINSINGNVTQLQQSFDGQNIPSNLQREQEAGARSNGLKNNGSEMSSAQSGNARSSENDGSSSDRQRSSGSSEEKTFIDSARLRRERKNRPGQKFGAKKKSWVWTWFVQDSNNSNVAVCDFCGKIITRMPSDKGSPKKLSEHLRTHKLTKDSINTSRAVPIDGNGLTYNTGGIQVPYSNAYSQQSAAGNGIGGVIGMTPQAQIHQSQQTQQKQIQSMQSHQHNQQPPQVLQQSQHHNNSDGMAPEHKQKSTKYRRAKPLSGIPPDSHQIHPQLHNHVAQVSQHSSSTPAPYGRRYVSSSFDNTPYSASKFHRHLLKFLAENKLSIRLLKSHSFQQLIYDLRPNSIADLSELTGLYSSFIEVSRADNNGTSQENQESLAEASAVNTLAHELIKK